jgi:hypothetical protein
MLLFNLEHEVTTSLAHIIHEFLEEMADIIFSLILGRTPSEVKSVPVRVSKVLPQRAARSYLSEDSLLAILFQKGGDVAMMKGSRS